MNPSIDNHLKLDVCRRSLVAAPLFAVCAALLFFIPIVEDPLSLFFFQMGAMVAFLSSLIRAFAAYQINHHGLDALASWDRAHEIAIWLNAISYGLCATLGLLASEAGSLNHELSLVVSIAIVGGSAGSIALMPRAQLAVIFFASVVPSLVLFAQIKPGDPLTYILPAVMTVLNVFFILNSRQFYQQIRKKFEIDEDLKASRARASYSAKLASLGEMAGGVAHEINNPLAIMMGQAEQIRSLATNAGGPEGAKLLEKSEKLILSVLRIRKIIQGLLLFSREAENDPKIAFSLGSLIEDSLGLCKEKFRYARVDLVLDPVPELQVLCRPTQISQVMLNLLNNAFDAVQNLDQKSVRIYFMDLPHAVRLTVHDNGAGVPKEIERKVFEPFFTTKDFGKGTGLGLSISRSIVEEHGGELVLNPSDGGASFSFTIPKAKNTAAI